MVYEYYSNVDVTMEVDENFILLLPYVYYEENGVSYTPSIIEYIRDYNLRPIGCMVAVEKNNLIKVGVSITSTKETEPFSKPKGVFLAMKRALNNDFESMRLKANRYCYRFNKRYGDYDELTLPQCISTFLGRCNQYHKDKNVVYPRISYY